MIQDVKCVGVSIVIPVYNSAEFLGEMLDSVRKQTYTNFEVILIDDGSEDESLDIERSFCSADKRFNLVEQNNSGAGAARNAGIMLANGEWLMFLDSDDRIEPEMLEKMKKYAEESDSEICVCACKTFFSKTGSPGPIYQPSIVLDEGVYQISSIRNILFQCALGVPWDKLIKRDLVVRNQLRFQEIQSSNDLYFIRTAMFCAQKICFVNESLINYRKFSGNSLRDTWDRNPTCGFQAAQALREYVFSQTDPNDLVRRSLDELCFEQYINSLKIARKSRDAAKTIYVYFEEELEPQWRLYKRPSSWFRNRRLIRYHKAMSKIGFEETYRLFSLKSNSRIGEIARKFRIASMLLVFSTAKKRQIESS